MFRFIFTYRLMAEVGAEAGGGGGTGTPAATITTQSASAASTPATGSATASPTATTGQTTTPTAPAADDIQDGNWKELRTRYEAQKAELARLQQTASPQASAVITKAQSIATQLGYSAEDFTAAFASDPIKTIAILNQEMAEAAQKTGQTQQQSPDLAKQIEDAVSAKLSPIQEFQNRQATEVAMAKYDTTLNSAIQADPILSAAPQEVIDVVKDYLGEYFSTQPQVLMAMKTKHDFSAVNDALKFTAGRLHGAFKAWLAKTNGQTQTTTAATATSTGKRPTLDEIIADPSVLGQQYK